MTAWWPAWSVILLALAPPATADTTLQLRTIPEIHVANDSSPFAAANALTGSGEDRWRQEAELRADWQGVNAVLTARSTKRQGGGSDSQAVVNECYYDTTLFGQRFSLGKKILSWDTGFGFRPLDVVQQEDRRTLFASTLEGVPYLAWEQFTADSAWLLVLANPGRRNSQQSRDDESVALKYFLRREATDLHAVMRVSERNHIEAGTAFASVADEGVEWHGSLLRQGRYQRLWQPLTESGGTLLAASDPLVVRNFRGGLKALVGATWTNDSGYSLLTEAWYDGTAYSADDWRRLAGLARRQTTLLGSAGMPDAVVQANLAFDARYFERANLLKQNLLVRLSHRQEGSNLQPAIDALYTPEDGGLVATLSLIYDGNRYRIDAGLRLFGGRNDSAYRLLPEKRVAYLALQLAI